MCRQPAVSAADHTPRAQGYYAACQVDYWYHGAPANECGVNQNPDPVTDFNNR